MPSLQHEAPLLLLRERPDIVPRLLRDVLGLAIPRDAEARVEEADLTQVVPAEFRADLVLTLTQGGNETMGIVVEVQRDADPRKRFSWPLYAAAVHAKLERPTCLVVLAESEGVARWASEPIASLQPGSPFTPLVLGPSSMPLVTSETEAKATPELAVLSAIAHGRGAHALEVGRAALSAAARLDDDRRSVYTEFVLGVLDRAAREMLEIEMDLSDEFISELFGGKIARAEAKAEARGEARAVLEVLSARGLPTSDAVRTRILGCTDLTTLTRWVRRAVTAATADDVFAGD
jgi:hypothetical protein